MKRNNTVATTHMAADAHADRLLGLLSCRACQRFQPHLRRVPDVGSIGGEGVVGLPQPLGGLLRRSCGIVTILDRHGFGHA
jgi:hypothetical protein